MGYTADTIILPCNRGKLEMMLKKICGSEIASNFNEINTQYCNWNLVVLPNWQADDDRFMIMSSAANKSLMGNMFFDRVTLDVSNYVDPASRNQIWNGYCRFGLGFRTFKHMALFVNSESAVSGATAL
jgi:hypothetical protein